MQCDVSISIDAGDLATCYASATPPPELSQCALDGVTDCEVSVGSYTDAMGTDTFEDFPYEPGLEDAAWERDECCIMMSDEDAVAACCDPNDFFFDQTQCNIDKGDPCLDVAQETVDDLIADCPWMHYDWVPDCEMVSTLVVYALEPDDETCGQLIEPVGVAWDCNIGGNSGISVHWAGGGTSTSHLTGNALLGSEPARAMSAFAFGTDTVTPDGALSDVTMFLAGDVLIDRGANPYAIRFPADQGYTVNVEGTLGEDLSAWQITPGSDAVGWLDSATSSWQVDLAQSLTTGDTVSVHLEGSCVEECPQ